MGKMALKQVDILPVHREASWLLLPSSDSLLSGGTMQPENTYFCILRVAGQVWKINHDYHQRSSPLTNVSWSNDSHSVLTEPVGKYGLKICSI